jgi:hypothetical protein
MTGKPGDSSDRAVGRSGGGLCGIGLRGISLCGVISLCGLDWVSVGLGVHCLCGLPVWHRMEGWVSRTT